MKLHFEPNLDYQIQAIDAVCDLFRGQETCRTEFTVTRDAASRQMAMFENDLGIGNRLSLPDDEVLANLHAVQLRHGLAPSPSLASRDFHFTVEMETGTGKTYVYLRTIFELNKRYGFTKFIIIVPSVAIKEGVYHTIRTAAEHLKGLYAGAPFDHFLYDSAKLGQVRNFASSPQIQIMVMTVGAINKFGDEHLAEVEETNETLRREKSKNVMYRASEKTGGEKPIDLIRATRPILIVDEPALAARLEELATNGTRLFPGVDRFAGARIVAKVGKAAGLEQPLFPHLLRHTYVTELLRAGLDIETVRELAGHRSIETTQRYAKAIAAETAAAAGLLAKRYSNASTETRDGT